MGDGEPLTIGEVLSVLREEFPDVTISKIRFLESQGLVRPERNASGYRQFFDSDVEQLRWILRQQRDNFLPLKVIKSALDRGVSIHDAGDGDQPTLWSSVADAAAEDAAAEDAAAPQEVVAVLADDEDEPEPHRPAQRPGHPADGSLRPSQENVAVSTSDPEPAAEPESSRRRHATPADVVAALQEDPRPESRRRSSPSPDRPAPPRSTDAPAPAPGGGGALPLTRPELLAAAGLDDATLSGLEEFGVVVARLDAGESVYGPDALEVASAAARLVELGVEPRHLRIYKVAADREAGFIEQLVMPLRKQRNPEAVERAAAASAELAALGARIHGAILRRELGTDIGG